MKLNFSKNITRLMRKNNLSQSALSRATGVPQPTINRILSKVTREPRRDSVVRIANFFGVTPESLYQAGPVESARLPQTLEDVYRGIATLDLHQRIELVERVSKTIAVAAH